MSAALAHSIASELAVKHRLRESLHSELSQREIQIFCKLAAGGSVGAIAQELRLRAKTVSSYRSRVLRKMDLRTNADLMAYAFWFNSMMRTLFLEHIGAHPSSLVVSRRFTKNPG